MRTCVCGSAGIAPPRRAERGAPAATATRRRDPPARAARSRCGRRCRERAPNGRGEVGETSVSTAPQPPHAHRGLTVPSASAARMSPSGTGASSSSPRRKSTAARCGSTCRKTIFSPPRRATISPGASADDAERAQRLGELRARRALRGRLGSGHGTSRERDAKRVRRAADRQPGGGSVFDRDAAARERERY